MAEQISFKGDCLFYINLNCWSFIRTFYFQCMDRCLWLFAYHATWPCPSPLPLPWCTHVHASLQLLTCSSTHQPLIISPVVPLVGITFQLQLYNLHTNPMVNTMLCKTFTSEVSNPYHIYVCNRQWTILHMTNRYGHYEMPCIQRILLLPIRRIVSHTRTLRLCPSLLLQKR